MTEASAPTIERAYRVRLRPTRAQARTLRRLMGAKRFAWNWALHESNAIYRETGKRKSLTELSAAFTALRAAPETAWLATLPREPFNQVLRDLERAFVNAFAKRAKFPVFKRRGTVNALRFTLDQRRGQVDREHGRVQIDGIGKVRFKVTEPLLGRLRSVTISLDSAGRWHASFTADQIQAPAHKLAATPSIGIDMGLKDAVVLSSGEKITAPKPLKAKLARLRRYQRSYARQRDAALRRAGLDPSKPIPKGTAFRRPGDTREAPIGRVVVELSKRSQVTHRAIGRLHAQVADQRREFQHQLSRKIVDTANVIALEDLNLVAMSRGMGRRAFRRSVADVGLGELRRQIEYKAHWAGRTVVRVDRFFPSSKTCAACGHVHAELKLSDRAWHCPACGAHHDRDINAARNILREGLRLLADSTARGSRGSQARGASSSASVGTTTRRTRRTANSPKSRTAGSHLKAVTMRPTGGAD
jgi:putative transposase